MLNRRHAGEDALINEGDPTVTVADLEDTVLIEHTRRAPGIKYVGNGKPCGQVGSQRSRLLCGPWDRMVSLESVWSSGRVVTNGVVIWSCGRARQTGRFPPRPAIMQPGVTRHASLVIHGYTVDMSGKSSTFRRGDDRVDQTDGDPSSASGRREGHPQIHPCCHAFSAAS
ncbi:hypothetical protein [Agromyces lapidis]|uniref:Uncharacterized protein n=1 Tax=Agromyces lapidis TaxID=279574 RepID=A0ABV5SMB4_9MICO|nr:hypothetical protein [Agromyces lapidis]